MRKFASASTSNTMKRWNRQARVHPTRQEMVFRLRDVGRVNAPEADMQPILPHRELLLKSLSANLSSTKSELNESFNSQKAKSPASIYLSELIETSKRHAHNFDLDSLSSVLSKANSPPSPLTPARCIHATVMTILNHLPAHPTSLNILFNHLSTNDILETLPASTLSPMFDLLINTSLSRGDVAAARRGELFSRLLDAPLRSSTYASLIRHTQGLELGIGLLHRSITSHPPNAAILNATLELCLRERDGTRARSALRELTERKLFNGDSVRILAKHAPNTESIDTIRRLAKESDVNGTGPLMEAYARVREPGKVFSMLDEEYENGKGVDRSGLEAVIDTCARAGDIEAALRGWRELRRAWGGIPGRRSRRSLWGALVKGEEERYKRLMQRVEDVVSPYEKRKLQRVLLRQAGSSSTDAEILRGKCVKSCATILHRWAREGKLADVKEWLRIRREESPKSQGIDIRLVLSLLSERDGNGLGLKWCLEELATGVKGERILDRTVDAIWEWIIRGSQNQYKQEEGDEPSLNYDMLNQWHATADKGELRHCLEKVVRFLDTEEE